MYEKMSERSEGTLLSPGSTVESAQSVLALDDRIDEFAELVQSHYKFDDLADPAASTEVRDSLPYCKVDSDTVIGGDHYRWTYHI